MLLTILSHEVYTLTLGYPGTIVRSLVFGFSSQKGRQSLKSDFGLISGGGEYCGLPGSNHRPSRVFWQKRKKTRKLVKIDKKVPKRPPSPPSLTQSVTDCLVIQNFDLQLFCELKYIVYLDFCSYLKKTKKNQEIVNREISSKTPLLQTSEKLTKLPLL